MDSKLKGTYENGLHGSYLADGIILFVVMISIQTLASGQSTSGIRQTTIDIKSPRPLAHALDRVQELLASPINYEEVPYENAGDLSERSTPAGSRVILRGGQISVNIEPSGSDVYLAVQTVLGEYTSAQLPGTYTAVQNASSIDLFRLKC